MRSSAAGNLGVRCSSAPGAALAVAALAFLLAGSPAAAQILRGSASGTSPFSYSALTPAEAESLQRLAAENAEGLEAARALDGAVDPDLYRVGPGDHFTLLVEGKAHAVFDVPIGPEGTAVLPEGKPAPVDGLTLADARGRIVAAARKIFRGGEVEVLLSRVRVFKVHAGGEVKRPGTYTVGAVTRASELAERAGGLTSTASQREIVLRRRDGSEQPVDLLLYLRAGVGTANPYVRDGDALFVPPRREPVVVSGEVYYPGEYEALDGDRLSRILEVAGGTTTAAVSDSIVIAHFDDSGGQVEEVAGQGTDDPPVFPGDRVLVRRRPGWHQDERVSVDGEVRFPGVYTMPPGGTPLSKILERAGGYTALASVATAVVLRVRPAEASFDPRAQRPPTVPVSLLDEGDLDYYKMRGVTDRVPLSVDFRRLGEEGQDVTLRDGDHVIVPMTRGTVRVLGAVKRPGHVAYRAGDSWKEYVETSGGFTKRADRGHVRIARGELGAFVPASDAGPIAEDYVIWVPEANRLSWWQTTREVVAVVSQLATVYLIFDTVRNR